MILLEIWHKYGRVILGYLPDKPCKCIYQWTWFEGGSSFVERHRRQTRQTDPEIVHLKIVHLIIVGYSLIRLITVRNVVAARLCFHRRLWFCSQGWVSAPVHAGIHPPGQTPQADMPRADTPPHSRRLLLWTVRILLECILVYQEIYVGFEVLFRFLNHIMMWYISCTRNTKMDYL